MITADYATRALHVMGLDRLGLGAGERALDALQRRDVLQAFWSSLWVTPGGVLEQRFCQTMLSFLAAQRDSARGYLSDDLSFAEVTVRFVRNAFGADLPPAAVDVCMAELALGRDGGFTQTTRALSGCPRPQRNLQILGFGADDCSFEEEIGASAQTGGRAEDYLVYRWDPFAAPHRRAIDLTRAQLCDPGFDLAVDLVTCRWALHHVEPSARWSDLHRCLRWLRPGGHLLVMEEGDFAERNATDLAHRLYRFLVMSVDVVTNIALRPEWFTCTAPHIGASFHVDFLDEDDVAEIERGFRHPFRRTVHPVDVGERFGQTVIAWHVGH